MDDDINFKVIDRGLGHTKKAETIRVQRKTNNYTIPKPNPIKMNKKIYVSKEIKKTNLLYVFDILGIVLVYVSLAFVFYKFNPTLFINLVRDPLILGCTFMLVVLNCLVYQFIYYYSRCQSFGIWVQNYFSKG